MLKRIFISSTFQDLKPHRELIWKELSKFQLIIIGMEKFGACSEKPIDKCLSEVEMCDYFILILAYVYGSIDKKTGKSFTELEYEKAVSKGLIILPYIMDSEKATIETKYIDKSENFIKLIKFKQTIMKNHVYDNFNSSSDLANKIEEKLISLSFKRKTPQYFDCKVISKKIYNQNWRLFVGYNKLSKPCLIIPILKSNSDILLPLSVTEGQIIKSHVYSEIRFDFTYKNRRGYQTTIEGINQSYNCPKEISDYIQFISSMLENGYEVDSLLDAINLLFNQNSVQKKTVNIVNSILSLIS